jgi:hypothetical protein
LDEQFVTGRLYAAISSRPGQSGRCDGYVSTFFVLMITVTIIVYFCLILIVLTV